MATAVVVEPAAGLAVSAVEVPASRLVAAAVLPAMRKSRIFRVPGVPRRPAPVEHHLRGVVVVIDVVLGDGPHLASCAMPLTRAGLSCCQPVYMRQSRPTAVVPLPGWRVM